MKGVSKKRMDLGGKSISCEGRMSVVYAYHFRLLHEHIFPEELHMAQTHSVPYFLLHSMRDLSQKVRKGKHQHLGHHGLIKMIVVDALNELRIHVLWFNFIDMDREVFIGT